MPLSAWDTDSKIPARRWSRILSHLKYHFAAERSLCHQLQGLVRLLQGKDPVVNSRAYLLLFHDPGNFAQLCAV